ncbi:hypothetical protein VTL71DRAFT_9612 [Oculimacula yallundae]|uniref:Peptidase S8/S53 domain-containing protein n=1 Tax=Oculimacula yallundae TaxID=86028 RepID=A0ABR4BRA7_9HELO
MHAPLTLALLPLISLTLANPLPQAADAPVTIANADLSAANTVPNSYIIVYKPTADDGQIKKYHGEILAKLGKKPAAEFNINGWKASNVITDAAGLAKVGKSGLIDYIEKDSYISVSPSTNDTQVKSGPSAQSLVQQPDATWGLGRISHKLRGYWNYIYDTTKCQNTRVYILDTGILIGHSEFGGRAVWGANFISGSPRVLANTRKNTDENGHGTHCAGTVAGASVGVCKKGTVVAVKVLNKAGSGSYSGIIAGMQWGTSDSDSSSPHFPSSYLHPLQTLIPIPALNDAYARGMQKRSVFSMSIGGPLSSSVNSAVASVVSYGIPVVVAAGNENLNAASFSPASAPNAITVAASDYYDARASFSNYGTGVDIFAPGVSILSSWYSCTTCYYYLSGTSMATPHVAGLAAYLIAKEGLTTPKGVADRIISLSTKNKITDTKGVPNRLAYNGNGY